MWEPLEDSWYTHSYIYSHTGEDGASSLTPAIKYTYTRILWVACELKSLSTIHIKKYIKYTTRKNYDLQKKETNIHNYSTTILHRILIQTLQFYAYLPTRQDGVENRDKAYLHKCNTL